MAPNDGTPFQRTGGLHPGIGVIDGITPVREQLDRAEKATLRAELVELRISARAAADLAEYATGEATDLRRRLDSAEQNASEERARADQAERSAERASARVQELTQAMAEKAATPPPEPARTRWGRLLRALGHTR